MPRPKRTKIVSTHTTSAFAQPTAGADGIKPNATNVHSQRVGRSDRDDAIQESRKPATAKQGTPPSMSGALQRSVRSAARRSAEIVRAGNLANQDLGNTSGNIAGLRREKQRSTSGRGEANTQPEGRGARQSGGSDRLGFDDYLRSTSPQRPRELSRPPSASKAQETPSFLSISNFRRRQRQPSILRMVQQSFEAENSVHEVDEEGSTLLTLGESSLAEVERSFTPQEESVHSSNSRKRKASALDDIPPPTQLSDPPSDPAHLNTDVIENAAIEPSPVLPSTPKASNRQSRRRSRKSREVVVTSPYSTPPSSHHAPQSAQPLAQKQSTHQTRGRNRKKEEPTGPPTTAALQSLLPQRRKGRPILAHTDTFDIISSSPPTADDAEDPIEDDDADELQSHPRRRRATNAISKNKPLAPVATKTKQKRGRQPMAQSPSNKTNAVSMAKSKLTLTKTYSRLSESNGKENEDSAFSPGPDDADDSELVVVKSGLGDLVKSDEIKKAKEKFREVDEWELSFESCDVAGGSSSPWR